MLERSGYSDTSDLDCEQLVVDAGAREGIYDVGKRGAKRVAVRYWVKHGKTVVKRQAVELLTAVRLRQSCFYVSNVANCILTLSFLLVSEEAC